MAIQTFRVGSKNSSSLAKGYDPLYSSSPVAATNQNVLYKKHMFCRKNVNKIKTSVHIK
jgi:hypothetical protein